MVGIGYIIICTCAFILFCISLIRAGGKYNKTRNTNVLLEPLIIVIVTLLAVILYSCYVIFMS